VTSDEAPAVIDAPGAPSVPDILVRVSTWRRRSGPPRRSGTARSSCRRGEASPGRGERSGKSTLVKILSGVPRPLGRVEVAGARSSCESQERQEHGVVTVFQEVGRRGSLVLDNVWLGADDTWRTGSGPGEAAPGRAALEELFDRPIDLSTVMEDLSSATGRPAASCGPVRGRAS